VRLAVWGHTNQLKGFGYVEFKNEDAAGIAVKKCLSSEGIAVKGRPVICDFETGQPKGSFKARTTSDKPAGRGTAES
jgi:RNA recognition motif-containing protein